MQDIWPQLRTWFIARERFALATVVRASKPSPRGIGSTLAIHEDGERFIGSVSAGCVENEVIEVSKRCIADGETRWLKFGPGEGFPWEIELSCGGTIEVRVEPAPHMRGAGPEFVNKLLSLMDSHQRCVWIGVEKSDAIFDGHTVEGRELEPDRLAEAERRLRDGLGTEELEQGDERVLYRVLGKRRRLFVVGASHIALHLVAAAKMLQYEVIVIDPRESYARLDRFQSKPDTVMAVWPQEALRNFELQEGDALVAITHDPKIDDPALARALETKCGYIGALGSKRSHSARCKRLAKLGFGELALERIHGPVGLDIGSRTPAEIAVSIVAQLIQKRNLPR